MVIVESGWGSILPTVIIASLMHAGPAEKSGRLNIGDQIMTVNGTSLVGLPLSTCQSIIKVCCCSQSSLTLLTFPQLSLSIFSKCIFLPFSRLKQRNEDINLSFLLCLRPSGS